jgi:hypothetical protein
MIDPSNGAEEWFWGLICQSTSREGAAVGGVVGRGDVAMPSIKCVAVKCAIDRKVKPFPGAVWKSYPRSQNIGKWELKRGQR